MENFAGNGFFRLKGGGGLPFFAKAKKSIVFFFKNTDRILLLLCVLTSVYGFILVYSAAGGSFRGYILQLAAYIVGLLAAIGISQIDYEAICAFWPVWAGISVVLVILTLTPLGLGVGGADDQAWLAIRLGSFQMTLQPAELMKVAFIITFSKHLSMVREEINRPKNLLLLLLHGAVPIGLVTLQGNDGHHAGVFPDARHDAVYRGGQAALFPHRRNCGRLCPSLYLGSGH